MMTHDQYRELKTNTWWQREKGNPILPPGEARSFDCSCCMNPCVIRKEDVYYLFYAGGDEHGHRRICPATARVGDLNRWTRHGPVLDIGPPGAFDANWCVLPHVVQQIDRQRWHLYYTGNSGVGRSLAAFQGIGLAVSRDGKSLAKYENNPVLSRTGRVGDPDALGIAGGSVLRARLPNGDIEWRFYYTGCPTLGHHLFLDQQKTVCLAVSRDRISWERRGVVMLRDPGRDYEDVAVAGPVVYQCDDGTYRMWYSAIGTRWGGILNMLC